MEKTIDTLKKEGHICEEIPLEVFDGFFITYTKLLLSFKLNTLALGDEELIDDYKPIQQAHSVPWFLRGIVSNFFIIL